MISAKVVDRTISGRTMLCSPIGFVLPNSFTKTLDFIASVFVRRLVVFELKPTNAATLLTTNMIPQVPKNDPVAWRGLEQHE